jgi:general secretion pathway protein D
MIRHTAKITVGFAVAIGCVFVSGLLQGQDAMVPEDETAPAEVRGPIAPPVIRAPASPAPALPGAAQPPAAKPASAVPSKMAAGATVKNPGVLKFNNSTFELLLRDYAEKTGRTPLIDPAVPKGGTVTLFSQGQLTLEEYLQAIETVLTMNQITLLPVGDKFLKVVPTKNARTEAMPVRVGPADTTAETDDLISQLIPLKYIDIKEAESMIKTFIHAYGVLHLFERTNSILLTDTASNVGRIVEILNLIDQPIEKMEEPFVVQIRFSKSSEIKKKLEQIIAETQKGDGKTQMPRQRDTGAPGVQRPATPLAPAIPGVIRPPRPATPQTPAPGEAEAVAEMIEQAERGMIRGEVKIVEDDRTNRLIFITRKENMAFFEKIIAVLDVETQPDVIVKIFRLEYAMADTVAETLNSLIGKAKEATAAPGTGATAKPGEGAGDGRSVSLRDAAAQPPPSAAPAAASSQEAKSKIGELSSANIKILPDKRTNSLLIMASKSDLSTMEEIIKSMDMMLYQVMIEAVIAQVDLDDTVQSGVHWIQRALIIQEQKNAALTPRGAVAGSAGAGVGDIISSLQDPSKLTGLGNWAEGSGLSAYFTVFGLNLDAIVKLLESDSRSKILASPRISTMDNVKAKIEASEQRYFLKGSTVDQYGNVRPETELKDIGLQLEVTPHINKSRHVLMEIAQNISDIAGSQQIGDQGTWPITKKRTFTASIAVRDRETIVLGGLVRRADDRRTAGVPVLSRIPLIGRLFSYKSASESRSEVVAFITPYVMDTPEEIQAKTEEGKKATRVDEKWAEGTGLVKKAPPLVKIEESSVLDPELQRFLEKQDKKWDKKFEKIDSTIENEIKRSPKD